MMRSLCALTLVALLAVACGAKDHDAHADHDHAAPGGASGGHVHTAPRGGSLVVLAEETAHAEILLDAATGRLSVHLLGAHADTPVRTAQAQLDVRLTVGGAEHDVVLPAVASPLTGETVGDTSEFAAVVPALVGARSLRGVIASVEARGRTYTGVAFSYPP